MTNREWLAAKSDEELAKEMCEHTGYCSDCFGFAECEASDGKPIYKGLIEWLKEDRKKNAGSMPHD